MPKMTLANPMYNDPNLGRAASGIAALLLGGSSPNEQAEAAAKAALMEAQTGSADATARKVGYEADILEPTVGARRDPLGYSERAAREAAAASPQARGTYQTISDLIFGGGSSNASDAGDARRKNEYAESMNRNGVDFAGPLGIAPADVSRRQASLEGKDLLKISDNQIADPYDPSVAPIVTPMGRQKIATDQAQERSYDANAEQSYAAGRKSDAEAKNVGVGGGQKKPMPSSVLKQYNEAETGMRVSQQALKDIADAKNLFSADRVDDAGNKIGPLDPGFFSRGTRLVARGTGLGAGENTRGLGELDRLRSKMRNNYLLLAKGVQTDRDATSAMDQATPYTVDPVEIKQQIDALERMTNDLIDQHRAVRDNIAAEYGAPGGGALPAAPAAPITVDW